MSYATKVLLAILCFSTVGWSQDKDPDALLAQALRYGDLYNWSDTEPLFADAERLYSERGDPRNSLYARIGRIRSTMEQLSLPETSAMLDGELQNNPLLKTDKRLRLFCLSVKGDIDGELDAKPARRDWEEALAIARELGDKKWENRASGEIGFAAFLEGDVAKAQQMVAGTLITATLSGDVGAQIRYLAAIGGGLALTGLSDQALSYFDRAANVAAKNPDTGYQFLIYTGKLIALKALGRFDDAEKLAAELLSEARARKKHVKEAQVLISLSGVSIARKDYSGAAERLNAAIALAKDGRFGRLLADAQFELASVYRATGDLQKAEQTASEAISSSQAGGEIYELPKRLQYLAQLQTSLGKYNEADAIYTRAADFVEAMVGMAPKVATKGALITAMGEIFNEHFSLVAEHLNNVSKAYETLERARGRATTDGLRAGSLTNADQDRGIDRQVARLRLDLLKTKSAAEIRKIRDEIFVAEQSRWISPTTNNFIPDSRDAEPLEEIQSSLDADEALLTYVLASPRSYCLIVTQKGSRIVPLSGRDELEKVALSYLNTIRSKGAAVNIGRQLFDGLLKPLPDLAAKSKLIIVRDGQLHLLPFDALVDEAGRYIARTHSITYAPSISAWYLLKSKSTIPSNRTLLALGGVPYNEKMINALTRGYQPEALGNLPGSTDEILSAATALGKENNDVLVGSAATEGAFKKARLDGYQVIHLAVHGLANQERPDQAALILLSDPSAGEDGILQATEVLQLRTNADLVVLSACDTAIGRLQGAEGIANLARAFLLSGARSVVATLWQIDDTFSLTMMTQFYKHVASGKSVAESLTLAKRDIISTFGDAAVPYYWAGYTLEGVGNNFIGSRRFANQGNVR
jgi:CHAT domain-containing protein/tetratricopeptide (TPR) repeat protein